ncbi:protein-glutamate O-methyltransferase CheR [Aestuariibacter halophilus]|uniref:protein-glutamate O-methyltransferase n=1 Tax=Fluctibacter halophilus TaxID=226011 RepID=A0ABS8G4P6_9ALTE|nr:protein-glutamate O-methyltransferase CheR [Aestuariibacter halophilus]MCC2615081.1 protein-glutamate O-methyltransferase CheR [Aestuariibacter halophilus]
MDQRDVGEQEYRDFVVFLERQCGIVLGDNKQYLVRSRLMPVVREFEFATLNTLLKAVINGQNRQLNQSVIDAMTTNETLWFRDTYPFQLLASDLLPKLAKTKRNLRIWSAACSSGQEPYSIAMVFQEYKRQNPQAFPGGIEIVATDLSSDILERARLAEYDNLSIARGLSEERRRNYFTTTPNGHHKLTKDVTSLVTFRPLNLLDGYGSLGRFDVVFCRNVLIYFAPEVKRQILQKIAACLQKDGILFLGASESISGVSDFFNMVRCNPGLYYAKKSQ